MNQIKIFDTTLRDGEQSPGCSMNLKEKIEIALQLERLKVDAIEAGFAIASSGDFQSISEIASRIKNAKVASLSRALTKDIDAAAMALKNAVFPRIHTFIATSDIHMTYKLKLKPHDVLAQTKQMVSYARNLCAEVEFSAEDATRSERPFLYQVIETAIHAGASIINIPDTVGYITPDEFYALITDIKANVSNIHKAEISVHCHNDLGLAVANSLAAIRAGATQIECTINGIGERAGNAALEEIVMILATRGTFNPQVISPRIETSLLYPTSRLVSSVTGSRVQNNKAIVGENAFAHESGIHQHGVMMNKSTYEIMTPESIGLPSKSLILGKHSGRHAFIERIRHLGYDIPSEDIDSLFHQFKSLTDKKKVIFDRDIEALIGHHTHDPVNHYQLKSFVINSGSAITSTATVTLVKNDVTIESVSHGHGPVDAAFKAIEKSLNTKINLEDFSLSSVTEGEDAQGEAHVKIKLEDHLFSGHGLSTDIIEASIKAYLSALNKFITSERRTE